MFAIQKEITAGTSLDIRATLPAYPPPDWTLRLLLRGPTPLDLQAEPDGVQHKISVPGSQTTLWPAGTYWYTARISDGFTVYDLKSGAILVRDDPDNISGLFDGRGHVIKVLEAVEAVIEGRATIDQSKYKINNRELERTPIPDLLRLRDTYRAELKRARLAERGQSLLGRQVLVRF